MKRHLALALAVLLTSVPAIAAGLPIQKKTLVANSSEAEMSIDYPQTSNGKIDAALAAYAEHSTNEFKKHLRDKLPQAPPYMLATTYEIARNDDQFFAVVFQEFLDTGGAHPNHNYATFNFQLPTGTEILLPEIVDGSRGIARVSELAIAELNRTIASGADAMSDTATIASGAGPLATNFKHFVWLPDRLQIHFPPYQVASYAAGPQEALIPIDKLKDVLRSDWHAPAPSFDCAKAATDVEKAICADAALARLDRRVAESYQTKLQRAYKPGSKEKLRQTQRDWLATRDKSCSEPGPTPCLTKLYQERLAALEKNTD